MRRERLVQLGAALVMAGALAGCVLLMPTIKDQRADLRPNVDAAGLPPEYALLNTALGPFRGLFVDWLWYRTEMLKRQNKIYEVNTNARWITTLQPRFPAVWAYHSWNLAYNISVKTDTEEERWNWVQKGVRLLREKGIPHNPKALYLYRELARTFWHKLGLRSDDMHYYYKQRMAERWQTVLGEATLLETEQQALDRLEPIATMAERHFQTNQPPRAMRDRLSNLAATYPDHADALNDLKTTRLVEARQRIARWGRARHDADPELLEALNSIDQRLKTLVSGDPLGRFRRAHPEAATVLAKLQQAGLTVNWQGFKPLGRLLLKQHYQGTDAIDQNQQRWLTQQERAFWPIVKAHQASEPWGQVMALLRAKVLVDEFNMDPGYMRQLADQYGPLDWRHPASHAVYWASLGLERAFSIRKGGTGDWLNTHRRVVQSLQMLFKNGRVYYSPLTLKPLDGDVRLLPDTRFVQAYEDAMNKAVAKIREREGEDARVSSFRTGHENFLKYAVERTFLYGDRKRAEQLYRRLRQEYGRSAGGAAPAKYQVPLATFMTNWLRDELKRDQETTRRFVEGFVRRAVLQGLATGRRNTFQRLIESAQVAHKAYNTNPEFAHKAPIAKQGRLALPPFDRMLKDGYLRVMTRPSRSMVERQRIYQNTPSSLQRAVYGELRQRLAPRLKQRGLAFEAVFPPPTASEGAKQPTGEAADASTVAP